MLRSSSATHQPQSSGMMPAEHLKPIFSSALTNVTCYNVIYTVIYVGCCVSIAASLWQFNPRQEPASPRHPQHTGVHSQK
jgi:hypothetical protein